jgi:hypothetical protein
MSVSSEDSSNTDPYTQGIKGSTVYTNAGVGDVRVALSTQLVRGAVPVSIAAQVTQLLSSGSNEHITDAVTMAFQARDVRGGKGERALFHTMMRAVHAHSPSLAEAVLSLVPEYGSWDDMFTLATYIPNAKPSILQTAKKQLEADELAVEANAAASISLLGKWAPREGKAGGAMASDFARVLFGAKPPGKGAVALKHSAIMAAYRKRLAKLNAHLKTVEVLECADRWDEIEPKRVPARARELKKKAYLNEPVHRPKELEPTLRCPENLKRMACREHFQAFFSAAAKGEVKISGADTLYPHELVRKAWRLLETDAMTADDANSLNAVWDQMVAKARAGGGLGSSLFMCDFSGSMLMATPGNDDPYFVSLAMGLLGAAASAGSFQGRFLTFDSKPQWCVLPVGSTKLTEQLAYLHCNRQLGQGTSTDFQAAGEEIIRQLKADRAPAGAAPKNLIVVTDMGFDQACSSAYASRYTGNTYRHNVQTAPQQTHAQMLREAFRRASEDVHGDATAWPAPRIVIWNVAASYSNNHQAKADEEGVLTLSGWSPSLFKVLCEEGPRAITPLEVLRLQLDAPRYDAVRKRVCEWLEGGWRGVV